MNKFANFLRIFVLSIIGTIVFILLCFGYHLLLEWLKTVWPDWGVALFSIISLALGISAIVWQDEKW